MTLAEVNAAGFTVPVWITRIEDRWYYTRHTPAADKMLFHRPALLDRFGAAVWHEGQEDAYYDCPKAACMD